MAWEGFPFANPLCLPTPFRNLWLKKCSYGLAPWPASQDTRSKQVILGAKHSRSQQPDLDWGNQNDLRIGLILLLGGARPQLLLFIDDKRIANDSGSFQGVRAACACLHANFGEVWQGLANLGEPATPYSQNCSRHSLEFRRRSPTFTRVPVKAPSAWVAVRMCPNDYFCLAFEVANYYCSST